MKLTIIRLTTFSDQDHICLHKIWPNYIPEQSLLDNRHRLYAARFNERLLAAVHVTLTDKQGVLDDLCVREVTRRRGVGLYLVSEVMRDNPQISHWMINAVGVKDRMGMGAFAKALGFVEYENGWVKA